MMREIVGAVMGCFAGILLLWFMLPLLNTAYESVKAQIDLNNPTNVTLLLIGDGVYSILPYVVLIVTGYLIFSYATRNVPFDV